LPGSSFAALCFVLRSKEVCSGASADLLAAELRVPAAWISGNAFQLQLGLVFDADSLPYFEDWRPALVPGADGK
jgi:hypothetical protein